MGVFVGGGPRTSTPQHASEEEEEGFFDAIVESSGDTYVSLCCATLQYSRSFVQKATSSAFDRV